MNTEQHPWWLIPIVQGFGQAVTWAIVLFGWHIVNKQNNARESRKEIRSSIDRLIVRIEKLGELAIKFHSTEFDASLARSILQELQNIQKTTKLTGLLSNSEQNQLNIDIRRSITLKNFDQSSYKQLSLRDPQIDRISCAVTNIIDAVENGFLKKFPR